MADTKWPELLSILLRLDGKPHSDEDVANLSIEDKMKLVRDDGVTCARYFVHRRLSFFKFVLLRSKGVLGKSGDYFGVYEFQHRGSPHCHILMWIEEAPTLEDDGVEKVLNFIDIHISTEGDSISEDLKRFQSHDCNWKCKSKKKKGAFVVSVFQCLRYRRHGLCSLLTIRLINRTCNNSGKDMHASLVH